MIGTLGRPDAHPTPVRYAFPGGVYWSGPCLGACSYGDALAKAQRKLAKATRKCFRYTADVQAGKRCGKVLGIGGTKDKCQREMDKWCEEQRMWQAEVERLQQQAQAEEQAHLAQFGLAPSPGAAVTTLVPEAPQQANLLPILVGVVGLIGLSIAAYFLLR